MKRAFCWQVLTTTLLLCFVLIVTYLYCAMPLCRIAENASTFRCACLSIVGCIARRRRVKRLGIAL